MVTNIDHIVLTVADIEATVQFYCGVLGMEKECFGENRIALKFGKQKINLHQKGNENIPNAKYATCGSTDICFIVDRALSEIEKELTLKKINIEEGIVKRTGANGVIHSIYVRDPDGNLIELSAYM